MSSDDLLSAEGWVTFGCMLAVLSIPYTIVSYNGKREAKENISVCHQLIEERAPRSPHSTNLGKLICKNLCYRTTFLRMNNDYDMELKDLDRTYSLVMEQCHNK